MISPRSPNPITNYHLPRRDMLTYLAGAGISAALWPSLARAAAEIWEEGDAICATQDPPLAAPVGYDLDAAYLNTFLAASELLTGVAPLDQHLANQFMERYATNRQLTRNLDLLTQMFRSLPGNPRPSEADVHDHILQSQDARVRAAAQQVIYVWYIGAFYIPDPTTLPAGLPPPLQDDDTRKKVWVYGTPGQYARGLLWSVIRAHAPMTSGGLPGHWANPPTT
jgi:hypothetical protein